MKRLPKFNTLDEDEVLEIDGIQLALIRSLGGEGRRGAFGRLKGKGAQFDTSSCYHDIRRL